MRLRDATDRGPLLDVVLLLAAWGGLILLVWPAGEFPLNDDWAYALAVRRLLDEGVFHPPGWAGMSLLSQALWGAAWSAPFGATHEALRASTLLLGGATLVATYLLARSAGAPRGAARLAALAVAACPLFVVLAMTFMTDVPFTAFATLALLAGAAALRRGSPAAWLAASAGAIAAVLCRQTGLFVPLALSATALARGTERRQRIVGAAGTLVLTGGALWLFERLMRDAGALPALYGTRTLYVVEQLLARPAPALRLFGGNALVLLLYLGLFLLPALILWQPAWRAALPRRPRWHGAVALAFAGTAVATLWAWGRLLPLRPNVLLHSGLGPVTLHDVYIRGLPHVPALPPAVWAAVTAAAVLGATLLAGQCLAAARAARADAGGGLTRRLLLGAALIYGAGICAVIQFDRYFVPLLPLLAAALAPTAAAPAARWRRTAAAALLVVLAAFAIGATRDYLAWNRARWAALGDLLAAGVDPAAIDGGLEFNGPRFYDPDYQPGHGQSWWWVRDDEYVIAMGPLPGYAVVRRYPYPRVLPGAGEIVVLRSEGSGAGDRGPGTGWPRFRAATPAP